MTGPFTHYDLVVVGQGLAGTAVAWAANWQGRRVLAIDRNATVTSSKIAAGLITPVTGQKLVPTWRFHELWPFASEFYQRVERETGGAFFRPLEMVRLLATPHEVATFDRRRTTQDFASLTRPELPLLNPSWFENSLGGFQMPAAAILDAPSYLSESRAHFHHLGMLIETDLEVPREIELTEGGINIPRLGVVASQIVFCQGIDATTNPWFQDVDFKPAKGEILTLRIPGLAETRVIHRQVWLAPLGNELFKAGSTYDWTHLDNVPTARGLDEIAQRLREFLRLPFEIVAHEAAVRPIHRNQFPVLGRHPVYSQLAIFNGLGSKGSLQAPFFADQLVRWLLGEGAIDASVDLQRRTRWTSLELDGDLKRTSSSQFHVKREARFSLTEQAQNAVREQVRPGEIAIDGTAGNGYDTHFLAELVGPAGRVYAFDVQPVAIENTRKRLGDAGLLNVILLNEDHGALTSRVPCEDRGRVAAAMFNLGYLPGGDKQLITCVDSTLRAIVGAAEYLRPRGMITILAYPGHEGGSSECKAVAEFLGQLAEAEWELRTLRGPPGKGVSPVLFLVQRRDRESPSETLAVLG